MIANCEIECAIGPQGNALGTSIVVFRDGLHGPNAGNFVVVAHKVRGGCGDVRVDDRFHALTISVASEGRIGEHRVGKAVSIADYEGIKTMELLDACITCHPKESKGFHHHP